MHAISPPRKNPTAAAARGEKKPLTILTYLGISQDRAEKALAATGSVCAHKAMDWLVSHAEDKALDDPHVREYFLYAVPIGPFGEQIMRFWNDSRDLCTWNESHNRLPHITLASNFKAPPDLEPEISTAVEDIIRTENGFIEKRIELKLLQNEKFIGFTVESQDKNYFETIALNFAKKLEKINSEEYHRIPSVLLACAPWCAIPHRTFTEQSPTVLNKSSFDEEDKHDGVHMTLAYKYDKMDSITLSSMLDRFEYFDASSWELRLYSRDPRIGDKQVFEATYGYRAQFEDEITIKEGDHLYATDEEVRKGENEGWIHGKSLTTGRTGYFPSFHTRRVPESDSWSLHVRIHFIGSKSEKNQFATGRPVRVPRKQDLSLEDCARLAIDSEKKTIPWRPTIGQLVQKPCVSQKLLIMRHAERVDYTFPRWTDQCFTESNGYERLDMNLPVVLPDRKDGVYRYPWKFDAPITNVGVNQAFLTGQMLRQQRVSVGFVYCSPAFRCIQTAQAVLNGMNAPADIKIRIEPALYEWCGQATEIPQFLTAVELLAAGYNIDAGYVPLLTLEELSTKYRREQLDEYYDRSHRVSDYAVKRSSENTLIVAHAANLETNSRLLLDGVKLPMRNVRELMSKVPYASLLAVERNDYMGKWVVASPIVLPLTHSRNFQFDTRIFAEMHRSPLPKTK